MRQIIAIEIDIVLIKSGVPRKTIRIMGVDEDNLQFLGPFLRLTALQEACLHS